VRAFGAYAYECVGRRRSSPRLPTGHPLSPARSIPAEEAADTKNEPTKALIPTTHREACRLPEDRDALGRHDTRRILREEIALPGLRAGSLAHAAHTFSPGLGRVLCWALQVSRCGHPRSVMIPPAGGSRVQTPLILPASCLGLTTQACQEARPTRPSTGADCPARTDVGRSA